MHAENDTDLKIDGVETKVSGAKHDSPSYLDLLKALKPKTPVIKTDDLEMVALNQEINEFLQKIIPETKSHNQQDQKHQEEKFSWEELAKYPELSFFQRIRKYSNVTLSELYKSIVFGRCIAFIKHIEDSLQDTNYFQNIDNQNQFETFAKELEKEAKAWLSPLQYSICAKWDFDVRERLFKQSFQKNSSLSKLIQDQIDFYKKDRGWMRRSRFFWRPEYQQDMQKLVNLELGGKSENDILICVLEIIASADLVKNSSSEKAFRPLIEYCQASFGIAQFEILTILFQKGWATAENVAFVKNLESPYEMQSLLTLLNKNNILNEVTLNFIKEHPKEKSSLLEITEICNIVQKKGFLDQQNFKNIYLRTYKTLRAYQTDFGEAFNTVQVLLNDPQYREKNYVDLLLQRRDLNLSETNAIINPQKGSRNHNLSITALQTCLQAKNPSEFKENSEMFAFLGEEFPAKKESHLRLLALFEKLLREHNWPIKLVFKKDTPNKRLLQWLKESIFTASKQEVIRWYHILDQKFYDLHATQWFNFFNEDENWKSIPTILTQTIELEAKFTEPLLSAEESVMATCFLFLSPLWIFIKQTDLATAENLKALFKFAKNYVCASQVDAIADLKKCFVKLHEAKHLEQETFEFFLQFPQELRVDYYLELAQTYPILKNQILEYMLKYTKYDKTIYILDWFFDLHQRRNLTFAFTLTTAYPEPLKAMQVLSKLSQILITRLNVYEHLLHAPDENLNRLTEYKGQNTLKDINWLHNFIQYLQKFRDDKAEKSRLSPCDNMEKYENGVLTSLHDAKPIHDSLFLDILLALHEIQLDSAAANQIFQYCQELNFIPSLFKKFPVTIDNMAQYIPTDGHFGFFIFLYCYAQVVFDFDSDNQQLQSLPSYKRWHEFLLGIKEKIKDLSMADAFSLASVFLRLERLCHVPNKPPHDYLAQWIQATPETPWSITFITGLHNLIFVFDEKNKWKLAFYITGAKWNIDLTKKFLNGIKQHANKLNFMNGIKLLCQYAFNLDNHAWAIKWLEECYEGLLTHKDPTSLAQAMILIAKKPQLKKFTMPDDVKLTLPVAAFQHSDPADFVEAIVRLKDAPCAANPKVSLLPIAYPLLTGNQLVLKAILIKALDQQNKLCISIAEEKSAPSDEKKPKLALTSLSSELIKMPVEAYCILNLASWFYTCFQSIKNDEIESYTTNQFLKILKSLFISNPPIEIRREIFFMLKAITIFEDLKNTQNNAFFSMYPLISIIISYCCVVQEKTIAQVYQHELDCQNEFKKTFISENVLALFSDKNPSEEKSEQKNEYKFQ